MLGQLGKEFFYIAMCFAEAEDATLPADVVLVQYGKWRGADECGAGNMNDAAIPDHEDAVPDKVGACGNAREVAAE